METQRHLLILDTRTDDAPAFSDGLALWWRPNRNGYTVSIDHAGRYTPEEALAINRSRATDFPIPFDLAEQHHGWTTFDGDRLRAVTASDSLVLVERVRREQEAARLNNAVKLHFLDAYAQHAIGCPLCILSGGTICDVGRVLRACAENGVEAPR